MIEIRGDELRVDELVLKWATAEEMIALHEIAKAITERAREMLMFPDTGQVPLGQQGAL